MGYRRPRGRPFVPDKIVRLRHSGMGLMSRVGEGLPRSEGKSEVGWQRLYRLPTARFQASNDGRSSLWQATAGQIPREIPLHLPVSGSGAVGWLHHPIGYRHNALGTGHYRQALRPPGPCFGENYGWGRLALHVTPGHLGRYRQFRRARQDRARPRERVEHVWQPGFHTPDRNSRKDGSTSDTQRRPPEWPRQLRANVVRNIGQPFPPKS